METTPSPTLVVTHHVAADARRAAAQLGQAVPELATTTFPFPVPEIALRHAQPNTEGTEYALVLDGRFIGGQWPTNPLKEERVDEAPSYDARLKRRSHLLEQYPVPAPRQWTVWVHTNHRADLVSAAPAATMDEVVAVLATCELTPEQQAQNEAVEAERAACREQIQVAVAARTAAIVAEEREEDRLAAEQRAAADAARAAGIPELDRWVQCGEGASELLRARRRLADADPETEWLGLAEQEWAAQQIAAVADLLGEPAKRPAGYAKPARDDRSTPTLAEIQALVAVRARIDEGCLPLAARLEWAVYEEGCDEEYYDRSTPLKRPELAITAHCPTGRQITQHYLIA